MDCNTIYISNVEIADDSVILIPNRDIKNLVNIGCYGLVLCCGASAAQNLPVYIQTDIGNIPVLCKYGNEIYANQLNRRVRYPLGYGNANSNYDIGQFVILSCANVNERSTVSSETTV